MKCYLCRQFMRPFLEKNGYAIFQCPSCGLGQTQLGKNYDAFVKEHYAKGYFTGDKKYSAYADYKYDKPYIVKNLSKYLQRIQKIKPGGKLLDCGCAMGFFVELAKQAGYDAYGFDPSLFAAGEAKRLVGDKRILVGTISTVSYKPKSFDIICMFDVFEHLADPGKDLQKLTSFLKDDGMIIIATGDQQSLAAKILQRRWTFYIPPQHLFFFDQKTLTTLLHRSHLKPMEWFRVGKWLSVQYVLHLARTTGESVLGSWLYGLVNALGLGRLPLYLPMQDNMVVIARKDI